MITNDDIVEITQVVHLYGHILDGRRWDLLPEVFTADAAFDMSEERSTDIGGQVLEGLTAISAAFESIDHALAHHVSNVYVYEAGGETRSLCKFFMPDPMGRFHTGEYDDRMERMPDGWRIAHRSIKERRFWDANHIPRSALPVAQMPPT